MTTKYEIHKLDGYTMLAKETCAKNGQDSVTVRIEAGHVRGVDYVGVYIFVHVWEHGDLRTGYFRAPSIREGWQIYRELCHLYRMGVK